MLPNDTKQNNQVFNQHIDELLKRLSISADELEVRKNYLNLASVDLEKLNCLSDFLASQPLTFIDSFYESIMSFPVGQEMLGNGSGLNKLKLKQTQYFTDLLKADINLDYIAGRQRIGAIHQKIGLVPRWYIGAYSRYIEGLLPYIQKSCEQDMSNLVTTITALLKVVFLDMSLALDTYHEAGLMEKDRLHQMNLANEQHYRELVENNCYWLWETNEKGQYTYVSPSVVELLGYEADDFIGASVLDLMSPVNANKLGYIFDELLFQKCSYSSLECILQHKEGHEVIVESSGIPLLDSDNNLTGFRGITRDVSSRNTHKVLDEKLSRALEQSADIVMICDCQGIIEYVNQSFEKVTGYSRDEVIGNKPDLLKSGLQSKEIYEKLWSTLYSGQAFSEVIINRKKDNSLYYEEKTITPLVDDNSGEITHFISTGKDITERIDTENRLYYLMHHNAITGLPNHTFLKEKLDLALGKCQIESVKMAIFKLDLDRFKVINDSLGYEVGDLVLQQVASRLKQIVYNDMILAHSGGDKFIIVLQTLQNLDVISEFVEKILTTFKSSFIVEKHELFIDTTIGISVYPGDGKTVSELLRNAETAMNRAKEAGRSSWQCYTADMNAMAHKRLMLESELRHAIKNQEFMIYYQPQVGFTSQKITGFEALLRWNHPEKGMISPIEFIPVLEETGLIIEVGEWVLRTACHENARWRSMGLPEVTVAVNFSTVQFQHNGLVETIIGILHETGLPPGALDVEITESIMMQDSQGVLAILHKLRAHGVQLSMDDFGTGYSSLGQLKKIPINTLKLDQSFVRGLPEDSSDIGITRAIISMGHNLGMRVIAEGVETEAQASFLRVEGCDSMQGYLFSKPVSVEKAVEILNVK